MTPLIRDDIIDQLVPAGVYEEIPAVLKNGRCLVDGLKFPLPEDPHTTRRLSAPSPPYTPCVSVSKRVRSRGRMCS